MTLNEQKPKIDPLTIPEMKVAGKKKDYPSINDYYKAASTNEKPIQYQHGLSNFSSVQLGDDRVSFKKSLSQEVYRLDTERAEELANTECPHVKKSFEQRKMDYAEARSVVDLDKIHEMEQMMRDKLQQRTKTGPFQLRKTFKYFDRDGSGGIDFSEFQRAMELMGFQFTEIQQLALFARYDDSCTGEVNYNEFVVRLMDSDFHGNDHRGHRTNISRLASKIFECDDSDEIQEFVTEEIDSDIDEHERKEFRRREILAIFDQVDTDHNGVIDRREVRLMLRDLGLTFDDFQIEKGFFKPDCDGDGTIDFEKFYSLFENVRLLGLGSDVEPPASIHVKNDA